MFLQTSNAIKITVMRGKIKGRDTSKRMPKMSLVRKHLRVIDDRKNPSTVS